MRDLPDIAPDSAHAVIDDCWNKIGVRGNASCPELKQHVHCRNCPVYSAAAVALLDRALPADQLADWTRHFARGKKVEEPDTHSVFVFRIGAEWLALPTRIFEQVAEPRTIHSLPHRRGGMVLGVVNVRGELLVCVSLGKVLGLEEEHEKPGTTHHRLLVISDGNRRLVFPVDEVHGIHRHHPRELKAVPATVARAKATYTRAVLSWREKAVGCLDDQLLFHTLNRSLA